MSKTFTCKELGGICEEEFSGDSLMDVMQKGMTHMQADEDHTKAVASLSETSGESKEEWMKRMQKEFEDRSED